MRDIQEITESLHHCEDIDRSKLLDELFWASLARGMSSGTSSWGRLFADIRGWTKSGGNNAEEEEVRLSDAEAAALIKAVVGEEDNF